MNLAEFADHHLGNAPGADLTEAGPATKAITLIVRDRERASFLIASFFWGAYTASSALDFSLGQVGVLPLSARSGKQLIVYHGPRNRPRYDLLILDPGFSQSRPLNIKGVVASASDLRSGWKQIRDRKAIESEEDGFFQQVRPYAAAAAIEVAKVQRFGLIITRLPNVSGGTPSGGLPTSGITPPKPQPDAGLGSEGFFTARYPAPAWRVTRSISALGSVSRVLVPGVSEKEFAADATVGVFAEDVYGRKGVTTALHALTERTWRFVAKDRYTEDDLRSRLAPNAVFRSPNRVYVNGQLGTVVSSNEIQDSCFIAVPSLSYTGTSRTRGPMRDVGPGPGQRVTFDGAASRVVSTKVVASDLGIPSWTHLQKQLAVYTPPVTKMGDSGAALLTEDGQVVGFAHQRIGGDLEYSDWIWANSVFRAHQLTYEPNSDLNDKTKA